MEIATVPLSRHLFSIKQRRIGDRQRRWSAIGGAEWELRPSRPMPV